MDALADSVMQAQVNVNAANERVGRAEVEVEEVAADKGYHAARARELADAPSLRAYIPEPKREHESRWTDEPEEYRVAVVNNRRRTRRAKGRKLQRLRSGRVERSFARVCDSGGSRRCRLRGPANVAKRHLIAVAAHDLGRVMRKLVGIGKPRGLQGGLGPVALGQLTITAIRSYLPEITRALTRPTPMTRPIAA